MLGRLNMRSMGTILRALTKIGQMLGWSNSPKYPHRSRAHMAAYSPTNGPVVALRITDSTKSGPLVSTRGHMQHGPSIWKVVRYSSISLGFIGDSVLVGLTEWSAELFIDDSFTAHQDHKVNRSRCRLYCMTKFREHFAFATSNSKRPVSRGMLCRRWVAFFISLFALY
jgi:hypothetical protein